MHIYECFLVVTVAPMHLSSIYQNFMENYGKLKPRPHGHPFCIYIYTHHTASLYNTLYTLYLNRKTLTQPSL